MPCFSYIGRDKLRRKPHGRSTKTCGSSKTKFRSSCSNASRSSHHGVGEIVTSLHPFRPNATQRGSQQAQQAQGSRLTTQVSSQGGLQQLKRQQLQQFQLLQQLQPFQLLHLLVGRLLQELQVFERLVEIMGQTRSI